MKLVSKTKLFQILILLILIPLFYVPTKSFLLTVGIMLSIGLIIWFQKAEQYNLLKSINKKINDNYDNIKKQFYNLQKNNESLPVIYQSLKIDKPLPFLTKYAITPDFGSKLIELLLKHQPEIIIEASCGISTLLCAYYAKNFNPDLKIYSLEHDAQYVDATIENLIDRDLDKFVNVVHAPLKEFNLNEETFRWYDISPIKKIENIDFVIIDGPPRYIQKNSRYPALPLLHGQLNSKFVLVLDDADRKDEKEIVKRWEREYPNLTSNYYDTSKGLCVIKPNV